MNAILPCIRGPEKMEGRKGFRQGGGGEELCPNIFSHLPRKKRADKKKTRMSDGPPRPRAT